MNPILRKLKTLFLGNTLAQIITILSIPIISRLYSPENFADLAVVSALVIILANISSLRLDLIIPLSKQEEINSLASFGLIFSFIFNISLATLILIYNFKSIYYFIPLGSFFLSVYFIANAISVKNGDLKKINKFKLFQCLNMNFTQLFLGVFGVKEIGLILGYSTQNIFLLKYFIEYFNNESILRSIKIIKTKLKFLKFSILEGFFNNLSNQLPIVLLSIYIISKDDIGMLSMSMKILSIPIIFIGNAFSTVYLSEAPKYIENKLDFYKYTIKTLKLVSIFTVLPLILGSLFLGKIDHILLGDEWKNLGFFLLLLLPWYVMQLFSSPISTSMHMLGLQDKALYIHFFGFIIRVILLIMIIEFYLDYSLYYFIISGFIFYFYFYLPKEFLS